MEKLLEVGNWSINSIQQPAIGDPCDITTHNSSQAHVCTSGISQRTLFLENFFSTF